MKTSSKFPLRGAACLMAVSFFTTLYAQNEALPNSPLPATPRVTDKPAHADRAFFEKAAKSDDPEVAAFAQKTLPTLLHHLEMAKSLKKMAK
jgi:hypothetical protein